MNKEALFNAYCSTVVGHGADFFNDLNFMADVVEKLMDMDFMSRMEELSMYFQEGHTVDIKQAFRDFVISKMEKPDE